MCLYVKCFYVGDSQLIINLLIKYSIQYMVVSLSYKKVRVHLYVGVYVHGCRHGNSHFVLVRLRILVVSVLPEAKKKRFEARYSL